MKEIEKMLILFQLLGFSILVTFIVFAVVYVPAFYDGHKHTYFKGRSYWEVIRESGIEKRYQINERKNKDVKVWVK